jgi:hypothetical protein
LGPILSKVLLLLQLGRTLLTEAKLLVQARSVLRGALLFRSDPLLLDGGSNWHLPGRLNWCRPRHRSSAWRR